MKTIYTILLFLIFYSCDEKQSQNKFSKSSYDKINNWYYNSSPVFKEEGEMRLDEKERKYLENIFKVKHNVPEKFEILHQERNISIIDSEQAIIYIKYYCEAKDESTGIIIDTYYYDDLNTAFPILLKSESTISNEDYSIMNTLRK